MRKWLLAGLAFAGAVIGAGWSLLITPQYQAQVVLAPANAEGGQSGMLGEIAGQLGGLGNLVSPGLFGSGNREEYVEFLRSRYITQKFITDQGLLPVLFAKRWDSARKKWKDGENVPTIGQGFRLFSTQVRSVADDRRTGLVTVLITWSNREQCAAWANGLVSLANEELRRRAIAEATRNLEFLNSELTKTQLVEMQQAIYRLTESEIRTIMLAKGRAEYAFKVVDPAMVPDLTDRVRPKRAAMTVVGFILGGVIGIIWVILAPGVDRRRKPTSEAVVE